MIKFKWNIILKLTFKASVLNDVEKIFKNTINKEQEFFEENEEFFEMIECDGFYFSAICVKKKDKITCQIKKVQKIHELRASIKKID